MIELTSGWRRTSRLLCLVVSMALLASSAGASGKMVGGESWTDDLRVRTVASEVEEGRWDLQVTVLEPKTNRPLLYRSLTTYTDRKREISLEGLDGREYRFTIVVKKTGLEMKVDIRDRGEPVEELRATYENAPRRVVAVTLPGYQPNVMRVGGRVLPPEIVRLVNAVYTDEARRYRISGVVVVEAIIDESGRVESTRVLRGLPFGLSEAAAEAVRASTFRPATMDGKPVKVAYPVTVQFNVHENR
jgi:TonB family protein